MNYTLDFKEKVLSKKDAVVKYIFTTHDNLIIEGSYIDNGSNKNIICVPSQTMCLMGCKFCHASDFIGKVKVRNITDREILDCLSIISNDKSNGYDEDRMTLISYMGCGEPMLNVENIISSMINFKLSRKGLPTRFAVATCMPKDMSGIHDFTSMVKNNSIDVKLHLSLHFHDDDTRKEYMPGSVDIKTALDASGIFKEETGNKVEVHYALMEDVNDYEEDFYHLCGLLHGRGFNVKFLYYNEKETLDIVSGDDQRDIAIQMLNDHGIEAEYYHPPGLDIGASCGQFLMDLYEKFSQKEEVR